MTVILGQIMTMDAIPGLSELPEKLLSQCGLLNAAFIVAVFWLATQLANERKGREAERADMLKNDKEQAIANERMAAAYAELRGILFAIQNQRGAGADDD